jgi:hypothetical protein
MSKVFDQQGTPFSTLVKKNEVLALHVMAGSYLDYVQLFFIILPYPQGYLEIW